ncbi:MAG: hypothetical protein V8Q54_05485 [Alistipes senegalensis]
MGDDGISTYTGTIVNPGTGSVSVTWVSGSEVFTPVLSPAEKPTSLSFTAPANVTFFPNEALFAVAVSDKPDQTVQVAVYEPGLQVPMGALPETEAPGGYYYPLVCGIDVAGVNIPVDPNATWNDVFDPDLTFDQGHVEESDGSRQSLPRGLERADRGPDEAYHGTGELDVRQIGRSCGSRLFLLEHARRRPQRLRDLRRHAHEPEIRPWSCETRANAQPQAWRMLVNRSSNPSVKVSSAGRTTKMGTGNYAYIVRCVREAK